MHEHRLQSFDEFRRFADELRREHPEGLLFRGQADSSWPLWTTLERSPEPPSLRRYYALISRMRAEIVSATGVDWTLPGVEDLVAKIEAYEPLSLDLTRGDLPGFDYLGYLRQHGFPSPLLDWTRSPFIAAFFAFRERRSTDRAIFVFLKAPSQWTHHGNDEPDIVDLGWRVGRHKRHFLQRSAYTICLQYGVERKEWDFASHEDAFVDADDPERIGTQDFRWKVTLPNDLRLQVLRELDEHNLNAFSLFATDEALMETLETREIDLSQ